MPKRSIKSTVYWKIQLWLARRFMKNMTVGKVAVLSEVTGMSPQSILALHPRCRPVEHSARIVA